jgi:tripartite-type tricarboxylate transporter receptor subunit TctC
MHGLERRAFLRAIGALGAGAALPLARGQAAYPNKTIKIIAPVQPGGGVDLVARTIGERIGRASASRWSSRIRAAAAAWSPRRPSRARHPTATP